MGGILSCCPNAVSSARRTFALNTNHTTINLSTHVSSNSRNNNSGNNNNVFDTRRFT